MMKNIFTSTLILYFLEKIDKVECANNVINYLYDLLFLLVMKFLEKIDKVVNIASLISDHLFKTIGECANWNLITFTILFFPSFYPGPLIAALIVQG